MPFASLETGKWHRYLRFWRPNIAADVDAELAFHVDARTQELCDAGAEPAAARAQALREFGDVDQARRALREMDERHAAGERRAHVADDLARDVKVAIRGLARSPGLVAVVVLTFALGIGATSAIYGAVDAFLFRPLPGVHGADLVVLGRTNREIPQPHDLSFPDYRDFQADTSVFAALAAYTSRIVELETDHGAERIWIDDATANYFSVLGLHPFLGRTFAPGDDDGVLSHPAIVLTYKAWTTRFAADSGIVGRVIRINDHPVTVIGVAPPEFHGVRPLVDIDGVACLNQVWPAYGDALRDRSAIEVSVFGLLRPGVSMRRATDAVRLTSRRLERAYPQTNKDVGVVLVPEHFARPSTTASPAMPGVAAVFMTLVLLVLLVACANVASVLVARVAANGRELAIRVAIGASQWRLVRQVLVECALLAVAGGIGALGIAYAGLRAVESVHLATDIPIRWGVGVDARVVAFTVAATLLAALVAGLAPAAAVRKRNINDVLKSTAGNAAPGGYRRLRSALVAGQIAVSVLVLVCAGLFVRSSANATHVDLGFRTHHLLLLSTSLPSQAYDTVRGTAAFRELERRAAAVPGARSVALTEYLPFGMNLDDARVIPIASGVAVPSNGFAYFDDVVDGDYFQTMGARVLQGRAFTDRDDARAPRVAMVNQAFANAIWPGQTAVGKRFHTGSANGPILEIVGVASNMQYLLIGEAPRPFFFLPFGQAYRSEMAMVVHTGADPSALVQPLRTVITGFDRNLPVFDVRTMSQHLRYGNAFLFTRLGAYFASAFGVLALVLAAVGVYGVVSYSVTQRTREIGVRVALGARLPGILRLVMGQALRLAWVGVGIGIVLSIAVTGALSSILVRVPPRDPLVLGIVVSILTLVAGVSSLIPARRAARIDPLTAIKAE